MVQNTQEKDDKKVKEKVVFFSFKEKIYLVCLSKENYSISRLREILQDEQNDSL